MLLKVRSLISTMVLVVSSSSVGGISRSVVELKIDPVVMGSAITSSFL